MLKVKIQPHYFLFGLVTGFIIFFRVAATSSLFYEYPVLSFIRTLILGCIIGLFIFDFTVSSKIEIGWFVLELCILVIAIVNYYITSDSKIIFWAIMMLMARKISMDNIIDYCLKWLIGILIFFLFLCLIGVLPDYVYDRSNSLSAHTLGFTYYSYVPMYTFYICAMWMYRHRNTIKSTIFWVSLLLITYIISTKLLTLLFGLLFVVFYFVTDVLKIDMKRVIRKLKFRKLLIYIMLPLMVGLFFILATNYSEWNLSSINEITHNRLYYSYVGVQRYGLSLFGNNIEMYGGTSSRYATGSYDNFYIDSGLLVLVLKHGLLIALMVYFSYFQVLRYSFKNNNSKLLFWCIMTILYNIGANNMLDVWFNPVILFMYDAYTTTKFNNQFMNQNKSPSRVC